MKIEITQFPSQFVLTIKDSCKTKEIGLKLGSLYGEIGKYMRTKELQFAGPVFAIYYKYNSDQVILEAGAPVDNLVNGTNRIRSWQMKEAKSVRANYYGSYEGLQNAYHEITIFMDQHQLKVLDVPCEVYVTDSASVKDMSKCLTQIYIPVE